MISLDKLKDIVMNASELMVQGRIFKYCYIIGYSSTGLLVQASGRGNAGQRISL